ncbi:hypothetical protein BY458DRAFT_531462 [Sporodiniella umbellata]|nr:hypothetical protein BY458DRAFT_531462 [Sporodiniella umbellata]
MVYSFFYWVWNEPPKDGSYAPPAPHHSLLSAVQAMSKEAYGSYCRQYDPTQGGFSSVWQYNSQGECGHWQQDYIELHQKSLRILERYQQGDFSRVQVETKPRFASYLCKEVAKHSNRGCGGLADRMGGMISTFLYALLTDRAFLLNWAEMNPLPLEDVWEKPFIDWSHDPDQMQALFQNNDHPLLGYQQVNLLNQRHKALTAKLFPQGASNFEHLWNATYVEVRSNRGFVIRTFQMSREYSQKLNAMGLTKENTFQCLSNFLFRPTPGSRRFLNAYKALFAMESVLSVGIQIRTDDTTLVNPQNDHHTLKRWGHFLRCAAELAEFKREARHTHIVFFLVTDSGHLREAFEALNRNRTEAEHYLGQPLAAMASMVISGLPIEHIEPEQITKQIHEEDPRQINKLRMQPGVNSAYMENWLLGLTHYRVISVQGYGKMAAFYSAHDHSSISMPKNGAQQPPRCSAESGFTSFDWLSTQWSLG